MPRKNVKKLNLEEQKRIYNTYILTDKKFKKETIIVSIIIAITFFINNITLFKYTIISGILFIYLTYTIKNSLEWYKKVKINPLNKQTLKFKNKPYDLLTNDEKHIVLYEYKKSGTYNPFSNIIYFILFFEIIILLLKGTINLEQLIWLCPLSLFFLIKELVKMKKWYKKL